MMRRGCRSNRQGGAFGRRAAANAVIACRAAAGPGKTASQAYVELLVERANEPRLQLDVRLTDSVNVLKAMLQIRTAIAEEQQELIFDGVTLDDDAARLEDCGLKEGSVLSLLVKS